MPGPGTAHGEPGSKGERKLNVTVNVGEKAGTGAPWRQGTPGMARCPTARTSARQAAQVVSRLADYRPSPYVDELWRAFVDTLHLDPAVKEALADPSRVDEAIESLAPTLAKLSWSATHTTFSPNVCHGGVKTNVIPDAVDVERWTSGPSPATTRTRCAGPWTRPWRPAEEIEVEKLFSSPPPPRPPAPALARAGPRGGRALSGREAPAQDDRGLHRRAVLREKGAGPMASDSSRAR